MGFNAMAFKTLQELEIEFGSIMNVPENDARFKKVCRAYRENTHRPKRGVPNESRKGTKREVDAYLDGTLVGTFPSLKAASIVLGLPATTVSYRVRTNTTGKDGFYFKYAE